MRKTRLSVGAAGAALTLLASVSTGAAAAATDPADLEIQAHRGGPALGAPENTLKLFGLAIKSGVVDGIETDARPTKDGVPVIFHDKELTSGCTLAGTAVRNLTWAELQDVRCDGEPIPSLEQTLALVAKDSKMKVNVELKMWDGATSSAKKSFVAKIVKLAKASGLTSNCATSARIMFSSAYWRSYAEPLSDALPKCEFAGSERGTTLKLTNSPFAILAQADRAGVDELSLSTPYASNGILQQALDLGMTVGLRDRTTEAETRYALAYGMTHVTTDDPVGAVRRIAELKASVTANPLTEKVTSTALTPKTIGSKTQSANERRYLRVFGTSTTIPTSAQQQLKGATLVVKITSKKAGTINLAPSGSRRGIDGIKVKYPAGTSVKTVTVSPGSGGKIREYTSTTAKVNITLTGWTKSDY